MLETNLPHVEATPRQAPRAEETPPMETHPHNSSPAIESADTALPDAPRLPLRFTWRMDRDGRFTPRAGEFTRLVGPRISAFGRPWSEIAATFGLDPEGRVMQAVATRETWSGITLSWPADGGGRLPVELSGVPFFDAARNFVGYRGFGVCRDLDGLARLAARRRDESFGEAAAPQEMPATDSSDQTSATSLSLAEIPDPIVAETSHQTDLEAPVETPKDDLKDDLKQDLQRRFETGREGHSDGNADGIAGRRRAEERRAVPSARRDEAAIAVAGREHRLQRTGAAIVGAARNRERQ